MAVKNTTKIKTKDLTQVQVNIRNALLNDLESRHMLTPHFRDMVDDYIVLHQTKEMLKQDIAENGPRVKTINSKGMEIEKKNESIDLLTKTLTVMRQHLEYLGFDPKEINKIDDEGEDEL